MRHAAAAAAAAGALRLEGLAAIDGSLQVSTGARTARVVFSVSGMFQSSCAAQLTSQVASTSASRCWWLLGAAGPAVHHPAAVCHRQSHRTGQSAHQALACPGSLTLPAAWLPDNPAMHPRVCVCLRVAQGSPPHLRLPHPHADQDRPPHSEAAPRQGPQEPVPSQHTVLSWQEAVTAPVTCRQHQWCGRLHRMTRHSRWRCLVLVCACVCVLMPGVGGLGAGGNGTEFLGCIAV